MANRYWIGGTGTWNNSSTAKWSSTSGGSGGSSVPTSSDDVFFDGNSGGGVITVGQFLNDNFCNNFDCTGFTGSFSNGGVGTLTISGSLTIGSSISGDFDAWYGLVLNATSSGKTLTSNGKTIASANDSTTKFNGVGGVWTIQDNTTINPSLLAGTLNTNDKTITCPLYILSSGSGTSVLNLGASTILLSSAVGTNTVLQFLGSGMTLNAGTSTIKITSTSGNLFFVGGGFTYNNLWISRGFSTSSLTISGSNTFNDFKDDGTAAHSILFTTGTTQTVTTFNVNGSAGKLVTINSTTTGTHALTKAGGGTISCDYLNIQHSVATPSSTWYAGTHSTNNQATATAGSGWIFTAPPVPPTLTGISSITGISTITF